MKYGSLINLELNRNFFRYGVIEWWLKFVLMKLVVLFVVKLNNIILM